MIFKSIAWFESHHSANIMLRVCERAHPLDFPLVRYLAWNATISIPVIYSVKYGLISDYTKDLNMGTVCKWKGLDGTTYRNYIQHGSYKQYFHVNRTLNSAGRVSHWCHPSCMFSESLPLPFDLRQWCTRFCEQLQIWMCCPEEQLQ